MSCPPCEPHGDGVLFDVSIATAAQLPLGWSSTAKSTTRRSAVPCGHLAAGVTPAVWTKTIAKLASLS